MTRGIKMLLIAPFAIAGIALFMFLGGEVVKLLWNWLMPSIFGLRQLTFKEAFGLLFLCRILFGGISGRGLTGHRTKDYSERREQYRERFRQRIRERFGMDAKAPDTTVPK